MRKVILGVMILAILLTGCSTNGKPIFRNFKGESEHWIAYYSVQGSTNNQIEKTKIVYKGSDVNTVGKVKYLFQTSAGKLGGEQTLSTDGFLSSGGSSGGSGAIVRKDEEIESTVEWGNQVEKFTLKPTNGPLPLDI